MVVAAQIASLVAALLLLDASLAFDNVWPTPALTWRGELSIELAVALLVLAAIARSAPIGRRLVRWLSAAWVVLVIGHYADVTAPA